MRESIRCCISCILPCGALDVIRIVHVSGRVEEIGGRTAVLAGEIMRAYPEHVLRRPPDEGGSRAVVLQPNAELHRGMIYFIVPVVVVPTTASSAGEKKMRKKKKKSDDDQEGKKGGNVGPTDEYRTGLVVSDRYLSEILAEKASSTERERRRGRVGVWRPHLESIDERDFN